MTYSTPSTTEPPLHLPLYGATPVQAVKRFFQKYATFSGRASRSEYWWLTLALVVAAFVLSLLALILGSATRTSSDPDQIGVAGIPFLVLLFLLGLATIVPSIALSVRRLHDANFSGLLFLLVLVPYLGSLILLVFAILPTNPIGARFDQGAPQYYPAQPGSQYTAPADPYAAPPTSVAPPVPPAAPPAPPVGPPAPPAPPTA